MKKDFDVFATPNNQPMEVTYTELDKLQKTKLIMYAIISALTFSYMVMPERSGISVAVFVAIQAVMLWFVAPERKRLLWLVPIMILALNSFISANPMWRISNMIVSFVIYAIMFLPFNFKDASADFFKRLAIRLFTPLDTVGLPFKWTAEANEGNAAMVKRVAKAICITLPVVLALLIVLASADMVFDNIIADMFSDVFACINFNGLAKCAVGIAVGLYLFGLVYGGYSVIELKTNSKDKRPADLLTINMLLSSVLVVYTAFIIIQIKYLFAGGTLPYGLTFTQYARKGFFELLGLTVVNLSGILICVHFSSGVEGTWAKVTKWFCHYLCFVTVILLCSSFYRMWLYTNDDGLTRLRFMVMGFLVFEAIGLIATFFYIAKPKFNIVAVCLGLGLVYYLVLNLVPMDRIIAENQISIYKQGKRNDIDYVLTLSADASQPLYDLYSDSDTDYKTKQKIKYFLDITYKEYNDIPHRWQRYNLSYDRLKNYIAD